MTRFRHDFIHSQGDAQDRIIPRKTAVSTIVDALVRQIKRGKQSHRAPEILPCQRVGCLRHRLQFRVGFGRDELFESPHERRFSQGEIVQRFSK